MLCHVCCLERIKKLFQFLKWRNRKFTQAGECYRGHTCLSGSQFRTFHFLYSGAVPGFQMTLCAVRFSSCCSHVEKVTALSKHSLQRFLFWLYTPLLSRSSHTSSLFHVIFRICLWIMFCALFFLQMLLRWVEGETFYPHCLSKLSAANVFQKFPGQK